MKKISLLGSTGSIGTSTLKVAAHLSEDTEVFALAAHSNITLLAEQIRTFNPKLVAVYDEKKAQLLSKQFPKLEVVAGAEGLKIAASHPEVDCVVVAIVGMQALHPTIAAIKAGKEIGLANKEVLVSAGDLITALVAEHQTQLIPIDSEHSALFQCLEGREVNEVRRLILTASGGPFRSYSTDQLSHITLKQALTHPNWEMGPKITVDSSTLMNKGLEVIEAQRLFQLPPEKIDVVIHPQSLIHSMVEFVDGSIIAQMSVPDMVFPIQYALTYPQRKEGLFPPFDFTKNNQLDFYPPDRLKFPALRLAFEALKEGKSYPCYLNGANEVLVERFLHEEISWQGISKYLEALMARHQPIAVDSIEAVLAADAQAREEARQL